MSAQHPSTTIAPTSASVEIAVSLRGACERGDWAEAVRIIASHWGDLFDDAPEALDEALRVTPVNAFQADPRAAAVRDIRLHSSADAVDRVIGAASTPDASDIEALEAIARSDRALHLLSVAASRMIAFRVRGQMPRAAGLAELVERLGKIAVVHQPALISPRLPAALLQAGITRGLADDLAGATVTLREAYERSPQSRTGHVGPDAAVKSALFCALAGEIDRARMWLQRHDDAGEVTGWHRPRVQLTTDLARALVATESLDELSAGAVVARLEQPVTSEQGWAPVVTYAVARHALAWGDRLHAAETVRQDRSRLREWLGEGTTLGPLLRQAESDLNLALGSIRRAELVAAEGAAHPAGLASAARVALLGGDHDAALRLAVTAATQAATPRIRMEALAVQSAAHLHRDATEAAVESWDHLVSGVRRTDARLIALGVNAVDRERLVALGGRGADIGGARDLFPGGGEPVQLTAQQRLVLEGLVDGRGLKQIAAQAHLSYNTVKTHAKALYRRLNAGTRDEAIARAHAAGLL